MMKGEQKAKKAYNETYKKAVKECEKKTGFGVSKCIDMKMMMAGMEFWSKNPELDDLFRLTRQREIWPFTGKPGWK